MGVHCLLRWKCDNESHILSHHRGRKGSKNVLMRRRGEGRIEEGGRKRGERGGGRRKERRGEDKVRKEKEQVIPHTVITIL